MLTGKKAVLFDFDGTLAPNLDLPGMRRDVVAYTLASGVPEDVFAGQYIIEVIEVAATWLRNQGGAKPGAAEEYEARAHQIILDIEMAAAACTSPFDGIRPMLGKLADAQINTGVVTRNCRQAVLRTFPDILDFVNVVHARDDVVHVKPDPRHLLDTLASLTAQPFETVMVGDGALDMKVGKSVGMTCVGVLTGSSDKAQLLSAGADIVLADCLGLVD